MPADPRRVKELFVAALELTEETARQAFLDRECAGDAELRRRVEALLHAHDQSQPALDQPLAVVAPAEPATVAEEQPGAVLAGKYKLLERIGEGGMGSVWMAQQTEPVKRTVAVKLIKDGGDSKAVLARFEAERQALALMDHPNIAKVLDGGATDAGRPFFVMELVKGVPITKFCDARKLTPRQRLELFVPVCQAIQHAHQKGIIHRDIKPSNVLIALYDDKPVPKVIDFGVAKATVSPLTEATLHTGFGAIVGTPQYMSPEQATLNNLDIDTRSDIYSLGVLLYELLAGSPPFRRKELEKAGMLEILRVIREEEPPKPSTKVSTAEALPSLAANRGMEPAKLTRLLRGEIDWIVMKALDKERARRYETANGFARDIQRYLADEPVLAGPPSALYRLRKFGRRHRGSLLATAVIAVVVLLAGGGVGWALWDRASQQAAQRAEQAQRQAETEQAVVVALARVDEREKRAERLPRTTAAEMQAVVAAWGEATAALAAAEAAVQTGAADDRLRQLVAERRERVAARRAQAERVQLLFRGLDDARMAGATVVDNKLDYGGGAARYQAAFAAYGLEVRPGDTAELARRLRSEEPAVHEALLVALDDWTGCATAAATTPAAADLRALAVAADDDAWRQQRREAAAAHDVARLRELSAAAQRLALPPSSLVVLARDLSGNGASGEAIALLRWARGQHPSDFWIHFDLGYLLTTDREHTSPLDLEEGIGCYRTAVALRPETTAAHNNLGLALYDKKQLDDAIAEYKKAIDLDPKYAMAHNNLGSALYHKKQREDAIAEYKKAIDLDPKLALAHNNLGLALKAKGQLDDAIAEWKKAIDLDPKFAEAHNNLGNALYDKKQLDDAIAEYKKAIDFDPKDAKAHYNLGLALYDKKQLDDAIAEYKKAIELDPKYTDAHYSLGNALQAKGQLDDAIAEFKKAIDLDPKFAPAHSNLGNALVATGQRDDAIAEYKKAIDLDPKLAPAHNNLGNALAAKGQRDDAIAEYKKAIEANPSYAEAHCNLGFVLWQQGHFAESLASFRRGHELGSKRPDWRYPSAAWVRQAERLAAAEEKLPALQKGEYQPRDNNERLILAQVSQAKKMYRLAVGLYTDAFAADAKLADDLQAGHRYNAACYAALAAAGQGADVAKLDDKEHTQLRRQARDWLRADLDAWGKRLDGGKPADRKRVQDQLKHWQDDTDLAGVRDAKALAKLPVAEQAVWRQLWDDVAELVKKAGATPSSGNAKD